MIKFNLFNKRNTLETVGKPYQVVPVYNTTKEEAERMCIDLWIEFVKGYETPKIPVINAKELIKER